MYEGDASRKRTLVEHGFRLPSAMDNRPLKFSEFEQRVGQTVYLSATPGPYELGKVVYDSNIGFKNISLFFELIGLGIFCLYVYKSYRLGSIKIESILMFGTLVYFSLFIPRLFPWYFAFMVLFFNAFNKKQQGYFFTASFFAVCQGSTHFLNPSTPILPAVIIGLSTFLALIYLSLIVRIEYNKPTSPI